MTPLTPWQPDLDDRSVTSERIETVAFTPMSPRLRNELITRAYGDIAESMASVFGTADATWANLGMWASSSVGRYLALPIPVVGGVISRPFADGNRDVFADVGGAHAVFLATVGRAHLSGTDPRAAWKECRRRLRGHEVEPPGNAAGDNLAVWDTLVGDDERPEGTRNRLLILGFRAYADALLLDGDERSKAIFRGNVLLALHEQRRLSVAISVGFRSWVRTVTSFPHPMRTQHAWANRVPSDWHIRLENRWIGFATKRLVGIEMPGDTVRVSRPVPIGDRPVEFALERVAEPSGRVRSMSDDEALSQLYSVLDVDGLAASCWNDQVQRMKYITALFQQQQRSDRWFDDRGDGAAVVRPDEWSRFDSKLAKQTAVVNGTPPDPVSVPAECPLSDGYLDGLRDLPSHPPLPDAALLTFEAIRDPEQRRSLMGEIGTDTVERLAALTGPNGLLSPQVCRRARRAYGNWSVMMLMGLLFRSLPHDYAAARGVKVLGEISSLGTDSLRRAGETAHFVRDLLASDDGWGPGGLDPDGSAMRSIVGVRCLHSIVSGHLRSSGWDGDELGVPVNQEDVVGTALSFAIPVFEMFDALGLEPSDEVRDAYTSFWLGVGHLLGAPIEALTTIDPAGQRIALTYEQGRAVTAAIRRRHHSRSLDGVRLTEALMSGVGDGFPRGFHWLSTGMMRALGDPNVTTMLLAHTGPGHRRASVVAWGLRTGLRFRPTRKLTRWMVQKIGTRWLVPFMEIGERRPYRHPAKHIAGVAARPIEILNPWPFGC